jgi:hypothetical protein
MAILAQFGAPRKAAAILSEIFQRSGSVMQLGCRLLVLARLKGNEPRSHVRVTGGDRPLNGPVAGWIKDDRSAFQIAPTTIMRWSTIRRRRCRARPAAKRRNSCASF